MLKMMRSTLLLSRNIFIRRLVKRRLLTMEHLTKRVGE